MRDENLNLKELEKDLDSETKPSDTPISQGDLNSLSAPSESPLSSFLSSLPKSAPSSPVSQKEEEDFSEEIPEQPKAVSPQLPVTPVSQPYQPPLTKTPLQTSDAELIAAQEAANRNRLLAGLGRAASQVGGALASVGSRGITAPTRPDVSGFEELQKTAETPVQEFLMRKQMAAQNIRLATQRALADPSSDISKQFRSLFTKYMPGLKISENTSALDIQASGYGKIAEQLAAVDMKRQEHQAALKERQESAESKEMDRRFSKLGEKLVAETSSSRSAFGRAANTVRGAEAIERMVENINPNNLDNRQIAELARNLDSMLAQGQATVAGMKKLMPETAMGSMAKMQEYIMGIPKGAQQGEFVRRMMSTVQREKDLAQDQIKRTQGKFLSGYTDLQKKDPDRWNQLMEAHGLQESGKPKEKEVDPIQDYANKYLNGNYNAAVELLRSRGLK